MNFVKHKIDFQNVFVVNPVGKKGGLTLFWKSDQPIEVVNYSNYHIHLKIHGPEATNQWFLTSFHGILKINKKPDSWELLSRINRVGENPRCIIGAFNEILTHDEDF